MEFLDKISLKTYNIYNKKPKYYIHAEFSYVILIEDYKHFDIVNKLLTDEGYRWEYEYLEPQLDKPLSARLMPIPGKKAGDPIEFDFEYFAPSRVLDIRRLGDSKKHIFNRREKFFHFN